MTLCLSSHARWHQSLSWPVGHCWPVSRAWKLTWSVTRFDVGQWAIPPCCIAGRSICCVVDVNQCCWQCGLENLLAFIIDGLKLAEHSLGKRQYRPVWWQAWLSPTTAQRNGTEGTMDSYEGTWRRKMSHAGSRPYKAGTAHADKSLEGLCSDGEINCSRVPRGHVIILQRTLA